MPTYYTVAQVSEAIKICERAVRERHYRRGVGQRIGRQILFTRRDLQILADWPWKRGRRT